MNRNMTREHKDPRHIKTENADKKPRLPEWTSWTTIENELPKWNTWQTLADVGADDVSGITRSDDGHNDENENRFVSFEAETIDRLAQEEPDTSQTYRTSPVVSPYDYDTIPIDLPVRPAKNPTAYDKLKPNKQDLDAIEPLPIDDIEASPIHGDGAPGDQDSGITVVNDPHVFSMLEDEFDAFTEETVENQDDRIHGDGAVFDEEGFQDFPGQNNLQLTPSAQEEDTGADDFSAIDLRDRVVIMLLFKQMVSVDLVEKVWRKWETMVDDGSKEPLWRVLANQTDVDREQIFAEAAQVYAFKEAEIVRADALAYLKSQKTSYTDLQWERMSILHLIPFGEEKIPQSKDVRILFATHDPTRTEVNRFVRELKLDNYELQYAPESVINKLTAEVFPKKNEYLERMSADPMAFDLGTSYEERKGELIDEDALEAEINRSSLINLFEAALVESVRNGASDIHIFPNPQKQIEIHFRVDGELKRWHLEERVHPEAFIAVVKDNALNVDRFERDDAQDGFIQRPIDGTLIRYRVSVLPVANANNEIRAESIVIRVLDDRKVVKDLKKLGLADVAIQRFNWAIRQPHGMVILTGPTGSGKSTTLFAALHQVVSPKWNILTVEDPVEYVIPGVRQIKLNHKLGLERALRAILRHDPDIVMVGEMRDKPTAELAIKLANTGHLTFSTLHTNDAPSAISRLYKMGVEPFLIAYAINLVVAQRLLRNLCPACKRPDRDIDIEMISRLGFTHQEINNTQFFSPGTNRRCEQCNGTGYKGRRAVTETMLFSKTIRHLIVTANEFIDEDAIRSQAIQEGMLTLRDSARSVVLQGETSIEEMIRVTAGEI